MAEFRKPINFWGRVYEEISARPVAGAEVAFTVVADPNPGVERDATSSHTTSDAEGRFSLLGKQSAYPGRLPARC